MLELPGSYLAQCKLMPSHDKGKDQKGFISVTMLARRLLLSYWSCTLIPSSR